MMEPIGEYVLATKYDDGGLYDHFFVGFVSGYTEHDPKRYLIVDDDGVNQRGNGFRRAEKITGDEGQQLLDGMPGFAAIPGESLWWHLAQIRAEKGTE